MHGGPRRLGEENQVISHHTKSQDIKTTRHLLKSGEALTLFQRSGKPEVTEAEACSREPALDLVWKGRGQAPPPATGSLGTPGLQWLGLSRIWLRAGLLLLVLVRCSGPHA